jgi:hypothetical protein
MLPNHRISVVELEQIYRDAAKANGRRFIKLPGRMMLDIVVKHNQKFIVNDNKWPFVKEAAE